MIDFLPVIHRIKEILLNEKKKSRILDREIALALKLDPQYFAVIKRRKKIPYESIAYFCKEYHINMNWVLLGEGPRHLT